MPMIERSAVTVRIPLPENLDTTPLRKLVQMAGGCTIIPGLGKWYAPDGRVHKEGVYVHHMTFACPARRNPAYFAYEVKVLVKERMEKMLKLNPDEQEFLVLFDTERHSQSLTFRRD